MPTPYTYKTVGTAPAFPDFIADVLEATDTRKPNAPSDVGVRAQMYRDALCALAVDLAKGSDDAMNDYAERWLHAGQS